MPYTAGLLAAVPTVDDGDRPLVPISGEPPSLVALPDGCPFADRCALAVDACRTVEPAPVEIAGHGRAACLRAEAIAAGDLDPAGDVPPIDVRGQHADRPAKWCSASTA